MEEGKGLVRLDSTGAILRLELPMEAGRALTVDRSTGAVWVAGDTDVVAFDAQGSVVAQWTGIKRGRAIAVDEVQRRVWVAGTDSLWKFTTEGEHLVRLGGFAGLLGVEIDPGM